MSKQNPKTTPASNIVFSPLPLDGDAYYISVDIRLEDRIRLRSAWMDMCERLLPKGSKIPQLLVIPDEAEIQKVPTELLHDWKSRIEYILKGRGEL